MFIKCILIVVFCLLFWGICYKNTGNDKKNMLSFRSYPKEVQDMIRKNDSLKASVPAEINLVKVIFSNIIMFTVVFGIIGVILNYTIGFKGFADAFVYFLIFGEVLNAFDLIVIDLIWWRNSERIRFSFIPDKKMYQEPKLHIASFIRGIPTFAVPAVIVAGLVHILP